MDGISWQPGGNIFSCYQSDLDIEKSRLADSYAAQNKRARVPTLKGS